MNRKQRQSLKRTRDKLAYLEQRCDRLIRLCDEAEYRVHAALEGRQRLEAENRRLIEMLAMREAPYEPPPIMVSAEAIREALLLGDGKSVR